MIRQNSEISKNLPGDVFINGALHLNCASMDCEPMVCDYFTIIS